MSPLPPDSPEAPACVRPLGWILRLYPPTFRRQLSEEMLGAFAVECRRLRSERGVMAMWRYAVGTWVGAIRGAVAERCSLIGPGHERSFDLKMSAASGLFTDLRTALRSVRRAPTVSALAVATLVLGVAATTAIFGVTNALLLKPLPYPNSRSLVQIWELSPQGQQLPVTTPNFEDWRRRTVSFERLAVHSTPTFPGPKTVLGGNRPANVLLTTASRDFFEALGIAPHLGRFFAGREWERDDPPTAVVSYRFWRRYLNAGALDNARLTIDDAVRSVVGVAPEGFQFPSETDIWIPWQPYSPGRHNHNWGVLGLLKPGISVDSAREDVRAVTRSLKEEYGSRMTAVDIRLEGLHETMVRPVRGPLLMLLGAAGLVLLVASANVASLLLARGLARRHELAVRLSLGATRRRLVRLLFAESLLLAAAGAAGGLLAGLAICDTVLGFAPQSVPTATVELDLSLVLFTIVVTLASALFFGLLPAWRVSSKGLHGLVRSGRSDAQAGGGAAWSFLVASEVALALILLVGAALLIGSFSRILDVDPGFDSEQVLAVEVSAPLSRYRGDESLSRLMDGLLESLRSEPGVETAGLINRPPLSGSRMECSFRVESLEEAGQAHYRVADEGYFESLGIPLLRGRLFNAGDSADRPHTALVSRSLAERLWPGSEALGKRIRNFGCDNAAYAGQWATVVGVVGDVRSQSLFEPVDPTVYVNSRQRPFRARRATLLIRSHLSPAALEPAINRLLQEQAPDVAAHFSTLHDMLLETVAERQFAMLVLAFFAGAAVLLAAAGIYGVVSYRVNRARKEIGIRMALGASSSTILTAVLKGSMGNVLAGLIAGTAGALALTGVLRSLLFEISPFDPVILLGAVAALAAVAMLATYVPALRSSRLDVARVLAAR